MVRRGRQAAARVRRGGRAAGDPGDPQVVRRRLHRDERALARRDGGLRLAGRRGGGDGREGRRRHPAPQEAGRRPARTSARRCTRSWPRSTSGSPAGSTARCRSASSTRSSSPPRPGAGWSPPAGRPAWTRARTATSRCNPSARPGTDEGELRARAPVGARATVGDVVAKGRCRGHIADVAAMGTPAHERGRPDAASPTAPERPVSGYTTLPRSRVECRVRCS